MGEGALEEGRVAERVANPGLESSEVATQEDALV